MNYPLSLRKLSYFLLGLCMSLLLFSSRTTEALAAETSVVEGDTSGIIQAGGLLKEKTPDKLRKFQAVNPEGAEKTIENGLKNFKSSIDISAYHFERYEFQEFFQEFVNRHPEFFYISNRYSISLSGNYVNALFVYYVNPSTGQETTNTSELKKAVNTYENTVKEILSYVNSSWSPLEKALYLNDYLTINCQYDLTYKNYDAYDALVSKTAVCQGYTLAYMDLLKRLGIPCEAVSSNSMNHIWNLVKINGSWYHVDTTWNDPTPDYCGYTGHSFLLKSTSWFLTQGEHSASDYVYSGSLKASDASNSSYDNYFWNSVCSPFGYYNGHWYANINHSLKEFTGSSTGLKETRTLATLDNAGYPYGNGSVFANMFYYSTPISIQAVDLATGQKVSPAIYTLTAAEQANGKIYGFFIGADGTLEYRLSQSPSEAGTHKRISIHSHKFGSWTVQKASTCTETGQRSRSCTICGYNEKQTTPATGHVHTKTTTKAATFLKKGSSKTVCKDCGKTIKTKTLAKVKCKKGQSYTVGNYKYKIVSAKIDGKGTVAFAGLAKNVSKVNIKDTETILGVKFKVVQIANKALKNKTSVTSVTVGKNVHTIGTEAFYGAKKLKTITIKSTKLKKVGSNALKNINSKAKIKVPKAKLKSYKALLKGKGQKKTVKIY